MESKIIITVNSKNSNLVAERLEQFFIDGDGLEEFKAVLDYDYVDYGDTIELNFYPIKE